MLSNSSKGCLIWALQDKGILKLGTQTLWFPCWKPGIQQKNYLSLIRLTKKIVMLILLITGQRGQIITALNVDRMEITPSHMIFKINNNELKQGRQNYKPEPIKLKAFPDKRLCVVHYIKVYLQRTLDTRGLVKQLFLMVGKPTRVATRDSLQMGQDCHDTGRHWCHPL